MGRGELSIVLAAVGVVAAAAGCRGDDDRANTARGGAAAGWSPAAAETHPIQPATADDGQWPMAGKDYANTRYSGLTEITTANVGQLHLAWSFTTGLTHGHEAAPLVVGDTMYVVLPFPNHLIAFDPITGKTKWEYDPKPDIAAQGVACCDLVNRGAAYADGKIFYAALDTQAVAVDAATGAEVWKTRLGDIHQGETITMAPIVVGDKVLFGNSGGELGVRGWLTAVDANTGAIAWRAYATGPDAECLIGPSFKPYYASDRGTDLGLTTWPPEKWKNGGGNSWGWVTYDPTLDLIYYGTGNPGPWNPEQRTGANKWTAGIFARKPETGEAVWFYQWSPHDLYDHDGINESIVVDLEIGGQVRHVLLHPERNGYIYVLDRATGQVLSADPFTHNTVSRGVDLTTGALIEVPEKATHVGATVRDICPHAAGAKDWEPSAWSPRTGLLYIPHMNMCMDYEATEVSYIAGTPYVGANVRMYPGPGGNRGVFTAWDPVQRKAVWSIPEDLPVFSGAVVTAGDVVFYGTMDGIFKALDARTGRELWRYQFPSGIVGQPITFRGRDGKQYVAILSGVGGWAGAVVSTGADPNDHTAALRFAAAMHDLPSRTKKGGALYVFSL